MYDIERVVWESGTVLVKLVVFSTGDFTEGGIVDKSAAVGDVVWMTVDENTVMADAIKPLVKTFLEIDEAVTFTTDEVEPLTTDDDLVILVTIEIVGFDTTVVFIVT